MRFEGKERRMSWEEWGEFEVRKKRMNEKEGKKWVGEEKEKNNDKWREKKK